MERDKEKTTGVETIYSLGATPSSDKSPPRRKLSLTTVSRAKAAPVALRRSLRDDRLPLVDDDEDDGTGGGDMDESRTDSEGLAAGKGALSGRE